MNAITSFARSHSSQVMLFCAAVGNPAIAVRDDRDDQITALDLPQAGLEGLPLALRSEVLHHHRHATCRDHGVARRNAVFLESSDVDDIKTLRACVTVRQIYHKPNQSPHTRHHSPTPMVHRCVPPALLTLCLAVSVSARTKTDVVVMTNGDRFTCEIKRLERGVLYASFKYADGTVLLEWSQVARVESTQLFIVHVQDGSIYEGTIRTSDTSPQQVVKLEVLEEAGKKDLLPQDKVVELAPTSESIFRRLSGNLDTGLIYTKGNDTAQYNAGGALRVRGEHWRVAGDFISTFSRSSGADAATRNQTRVWARRLIGGKRAWYYSGAAEFLQSSQQGINLQTIFGGGIGRFLKDSNSTRMAITADLAVQQTNYATADADENQPRTLAAMINWDLHLFRFKKTAFDVTMSVLPALNDAGRVYSYLNSAYSIQVINNLWFKLSFYGNWDTRPPKNFAGSDYGMSSSISYSFN